MSGNEIKTFIRDEFKVIEVTTSKAKYQGIAWKNCSEFQKRKYENLIFLTNNTGLPMKVIYL